MTEPIKQEIISCIYENGKNLITGPVLQEVLLDMVDDTNAKVASPGDLVNKTGSWDNAADWVEQNSSSVVLQPDLDGYATEQWVQNQGYLKEHQDLGGYATTESLNNLSESVANDLANLPEPDLSDYATKGYVEATSASVKEWVENKQYLTSASLSVTEESVQFMINDATASVKTWVGDQNYATETFVSQAIAKIPGTDLTGYATEAWVQNQGYLTEHQDISGLATTSSVNQLSESVAQTIENLPQADLSGYLQTSSYLVDSASFDSRIKDAREEATIAITNISGGVVALSASFDQRINKNEADLSGYATTASVNSISQSISQSINTLAGSVADKANARDLTSLSSSVADDFANLKIPDVSGYATIQSVNNLSASFAETIDNIPGTDLTGYATEQWVLNQGYLTEHQDISGLATTSSVNQLSSSVSSDIQSVREEATQAITSLGTTVQGVSDRVTDLSASFDTRINSFDLSGFLFGTGSASGSENIFPSASNWVVEVSQSAVFTLSSELEEGRSIQVIYHNAGANSVSISFNEEYWGPYSVVNGVLGSGSFEIPTGEYGDVVATRIGDRIYFRTSLDVSNIEVDLSKYATTESVNTLSASFDQRISSIPGSGGDYLPIAGGTLTGNLFVGGNKSIGVGSTKVGFNSLTVGDEDTSTQRAHYGLAVGENCQTSVYGGVALGRETLVVNEPFGVATGFRTRVDKMSGFAGGCLSTASGQYSFAAGFGAVAKGTGQVVLGSFNEIDGTGTETGSYAVILGNGKSSTWNQNNPGNVVRSNGLAIKWDGGIDINYSGSTVTLQNKIAELEATIAGLVARIEALEGSK